MLPLPAIVRAPKAHVTMVWLAKSKYLRREIEMAIFRLTFSLCVLGTLSAISQPAWAGPAVASRWQEVKMSQDDCFKHAETAIRSTALDNLERTEQSRYGTQREYTGVVRCITSNNIVLFIGSGPSRATADELAGALFHNFTAAAAK